MAVRSAEAPPTWVAGFSPTAGPSVGLAAGLSLSALVAARLVDPRRVDAGPVICPFRLATGLPCPGCGLTRSWVHLLHGQLVEALTANPFGIVALALAVLLVGTVAWVVVQRGTVPSYLELVGGRARSLVLRVLVAGWIAFGLVRMVVALLA